MFSLLAVFAATAAVAVAQNSSSTTGYDNTNVNYPYVLTPAQIATYNLTRTAPWCEAQRNSCPQICGGQAFPNTCDPATLNWSCKCTVGMTPNVTNYIQTIPFFECQEYKKFCVASYTDAYNQMLCNNIACASADPARAAAAASISAAIASTAVVVVVNTATAAQVVATTTALVVTGSLAASTTVTVSATVTTRVAATTTAAANKAMEVGVGAGLLALLGMAI